MIRKKTVMILGAGASIPYGLPSGEQLFTNICKSLNGRDTPFVKYLLERGFSYPEIKNFRDTLFFSGKCSIDEFLEHRPSFLKIGKCTIAQQLIPYEISDNIFSVNNNLNWYKELYKYMNAKPSEISKNNISFITFNYDRTLEHFLFISLKNSYGLTVQECSEILDGIKILHLHGILGKHPFQNKDAYKYITSFKSNPKDFYMERFQHGYKDTSGYYRDFDMPLSSAMIEESANCINVIHNIDSLSIFEESKNLLNDAEVILFFGFGFHDLNIQRLGLSKLSHNAKYIAGTGIGLSEIQKDSIEQKTNKFIMKHRLYDVDIANFLRQIYILK